MTFMCALFNQLKNNDSGRENTKQLKNMKMETKRKKGNVKRKIYFEREREKKCN